MRTFLKIVSLTLLIQQLEAQCTMEKALPQFKRGTWKLTTTLLKRIAEDTENHFVTCPTSTWALLAALREDAEGHTSDELQSMLYLHLHPCFRRHYYDIVNAVLTQGELLERSGLLVFDDALNINDTFKKNPARLGLGDVVSLSLDEDNAADVINEQIASDIHGKLNDVISSEDLEGKLCLLIDAIHFKGTWEYSFKTEVSPFYDEKEVRIGEVTLMHHFGNYLNGYMYLLNANFLEVPYKSEHDNQYAMIIILPVKGETVSNVLEKLSSLTLTSIYNVISENGKTAMHLSFPKFKMSSYLDNLKELLVDAGLRTMFDERKASFPLISESMYVNDLIQKVEMEVSEEGEFRNKDIVSEGYQESFLVNKPFIFLIADKPAQTFILTGVYSKPSVT